MSDRHSPHATAFTPVRFVHGRHRGHVDWRHSANEAELGRLLREHTPRCEIARVFGVSPDTINWRLSFLRPLKLAEQALRGDRADTRRRRRCLGGCGLPFDSSGPGHRICGDCAAGVEHRRGGFDEHALLGV